MKYSPEIVVSGPMKKMSITILLQCSYILGKSVIWGCFKGYLKKKVQSFLFLKNHVKLEILFLTFKVLLFLIMYIGFLLFSLDYVVCTNYVIQRFHCEIYFWDLAGFFQLNLASDAGLHIGR